MITEKVKPADVIAAQAVEMSSKFITPEATYQVILLFLY